MCYAYLVDGTVEIGMDEVHEMMTDDGRRYGHYGYSHGCC